MFNCRFSFTHHGKLMCVLQEDCASKSLQEKTVCKKVSEHYYNLTPQEIQELQRKLISEENKKNPISYQNDDNLILMEDPEEHDKRIAQSREKLQKLKINF